MNIIKRELKFCVSCMEEHEVLVVELEEKRNLKNEKISFKAYYEYCPNTDEYFESEDMIRANSLALKDAYRSKVGLLTSIEIKSIRQKYSISQKEFSEVLGWGKATITRYENHQIQDRAHDDILRKIDSDPDWFLEMIKRAKDNIESKHYDSYYKNATKELRKKANLYTYNFNELEYTIANQSISVGLKFDEICSGKINNVDNTCKINYIAIENRIDESNAEVA